ncbi:MAG: response regulator transcription factor [Acidobacteriota bacterium]
MSRIRVFIVDDHYVLRAGLRDMLHKEPDVEVVGTAASAAEALEALAGPLAIDVLLTDLRMPDRGGDELATELRKTREDLRVVFLSNYHSDEDIFSAVKAGAMGYLLKSSTMEQILDAIRRVYSGSAYFPPNISRQLAQRLTRVELTAREMDVLRWAAKGLRNREIGDKLFISENTVRNHMLSLMAKLGTTHRTEAIAISIQQGLIRLRSEESV